MRHLTIRRSAVVAAAAALALAASACGSSSGGSDKITLTVWTPFTGGAQLQAVKAQDALFEKTHPNVTVQALTVGNNTMDPKLLAGKSTKNGPDIILNNVVVDFPTLSSGGLLLDLTQKWNSYAGKDQFPQAGIWKSPDNKIYNIMSYTNLLGLYYNKTILDQYNLKPPTTMAEFESDMKTVAAGGKYTPLAASADPDVDGAWTWMPQLLSQDVNYCNFSGNKVDQLFQTVQQWAQDKYIPRESATWTQSNSWTAFMTGKYAFGINGNWNLGDAKAATFKWGTTQYPAGPDGSHVFPGGEGLGIGAFSKHPDLAWQYLEQSWLSKQGSVLDFTGSGQIPTRAEVAQTPEVTSNAVAAPFVAATKTVSAWPRNPRTADMQTAVGTNISAVVSGQSAPAAAAAKAISTVNADLKAGGGAC